MYGQMPVVTTNLHLVSLQIEEGAMYGILSSKCYHIFVRRSADAARRHADFSDTFDSELQTSPSLRLIYIYLLSMAQNTPKLDPSQRPTTAAELKWDAHVNKKRKGLEHGINDQPPGGDAIDDKGENDDACHAASASGADTTETADAKDSEGTSWVAGPSAHAQSKHARPPSQHESSNSSKLLRAGRSRQAEKLLKCLPLVVRPSLGSTIHIGRDCVVRLLHLCPSLHKVLASWERSGKFCFDNTLDWLIFGQSCSVPVVYASQAQCRCVCNRTGLGNHLQADVVGKSQMTCD